MKDQEQDFDIYSTGMILVHSDSDNALVCIHSREELDRIKREDAELQAFLDNLYREVKADGIC